MYSINNRIGLMLATTAALLLPAAAQAKDPSAEMMANTCVGCHGNKGVSNGPAIPSIAGMSASYFMDAMTEYASNERASSIMGRIARGYSKSQLESMSGYFAKLKAKGARQPFDKSKVSAGAKLHKKYCEKCHEDGGTSAEDDAGILAGQWKTYLGYAMEDFHAERRSVPKKMKKRVSEMLKKKGQGSINTVNEYYASQQ